jgi:PTH1 family peptidyl-tRNA hydrolase
VLGTFHEDEGAQVQDLIDRAADAVETIVLDGVTTAMNRFNEDSTQDAN